MNPLSAFVDRSLNLGTPVATGRLTVVPLLATQDLDLPYLTLAEALMAGSLELGEIEGGVVPEIRAANHHDRPVLILEGEEVVGAKQNRVFNTTILLAAHSTSVVPVTCMEQGRWHFDTVAFAHSGHSVPPSIRAHYTASVGHSLRRGGTRHSDQVGAWRVVAAASDRAHVSSPTGALRDVYADRQADLDASVTELVVARGQVGAIALVDGTPIGLDCTSSPALFERLATRLYRGYALEALLATKETASRGVGESHGREGPPGIADTREHGDGVTGAHAAAEALLADIAACEATEYPGVALGREVRLQGPNTVGLALLDGDTLVHGAVQRRVTPPPFDRSYWVEPGWLLAGYYPGAPAKAEAEHKLDALLDSGVRCVIDLTAEGEHGHDGHPLRPYANLLMRRAAARGASVTYIRLPVADMTVPPTNTMRAILDAIDAARARRQPAYVHCWGGRGRTGVAVGCYLARHRRASGSEALALLQQLRQEEATAATPSPDTEAQREMVRGWPRGM